MLFAEVAKIVMACDWLLVLLFVVWFGCVVCLCWCVCVCASLVAFGGRFAAAFCSRSAGVMLLSARAFGLVYPCAWVLLKAVLGTKMTRFFRGAYFLQSFSWHVWLQLCSAARWLSLIGD